MKLIVFAFALFLFFGNAFVATSASKIKGDVKGALVDKLTGEALEFATVSLLDTAKKVVAGSMTDTHGEFAINNLPIGKYMLRISFIGYLDTEQPIEILPDQNSIQIGKIEMNPDSKKLEEAVVTGRRPVVERQMDKLVVNVSNMIMAESSTALEVLRKAPGVAIDKDGNITLNGQNVEVWVDNRPTQLSGLELVALLSGTEGSTIDKIEIIDQPSSKYDAAGSAGIINIKTKKNFLNGFNGSVRAGYTQYLEKDFYYNANGSVNLNYRNDLINTYLNLSSRAAKGFGESTEIVTTPDGYSRYATVKSIDKGVNENIKAGADFFIDKKNIVGVIGNVSFRNRSEDNNGNTNEYNIANPATSTFKSTGDNDFLSATGNLNYTHYFDESDHELTVNADYMHYANKPNQTIHSFFSYLSPPSDSTAAYTNYTDQYTNVFSGKVDYIHPIGKKMKLEAGGKFSRSMTDYTILREDSIVSGWVKNNKLSNDFTYNENVAALYATYAWQITDKWNVKGGLRWENTSSEGIWRSADSATTKNYNDLFPTLYVGFKPSEKHDLGFSYTKRIRRPNYWQLNPFKRYFGDYSYVQGNAELNPSYSHRLSLSYTGFNVLNAGIMYSYNYDDIVQIPQYDSLTRESGYVQGNFGKSSYAGIWVGVSELPLTKWWNLTVNLWGAYNSSENGTYSQQSWQGNLYGNNTFLIGKTWKAELEFWVQSPSTWSYFQMEAQGELNIGIRKTLWDGKGTLSLYADDILATSRSNNTSTVDGIYRANTTKWDSRSLRVSFAYRFGNAGQSKQRKVGQQDEAERVGGEK